MSNYIQSMVYIIFIYMINYNKEVFFVFIRLVKSVGRDEEFGAERKTLRPQNNLLSESFIFFSIKRELRYL